MLRTAKGNRASYHSERKHVFNDDELETVMETIAQIVQQARNAAAVTQQNKGNFGARMI